MGAPIEGALIPQIPQSSPQISVPYGALFFVFLYISLCDSFGGVDRNICGTVALYNETMPVRGLAQSLRSLGMTGFSGGVDSS